MANTNKLESPVYVWQDRKRNFLGLPWTFTKYSLDEDKLYINSGFFNSTEDEVRLYRITDVTLKRSLWQKIIGTGTIHCDSSDVTQKDFDIINIKSAKLVKDNLSQLVDESRKRNRVFTSESVSGNVHVHDEDGFRPDAEACDCSCNYNNSPEMY